MLFGKAIICGVVDGEPVVEEKNGFKKLTFVVRYLPSGFFAGKSPREQFVAIQVLGNVFIDKVMQCRSFSGSPVCVDGTIGGYRNGNYVNNSITATNIFLDATGASISESPAGGTQFASEEIPF